MNNPPLSSAAVVHGGAGGARAHEDGCVSAARRALDSLARRGHALDAAVAAVTALEDDGRFNAGTGSVLCLDGATVEIDASIMDSRGRLGAIACVRSVQNPVQLARAVYRWLDEGMALELALQRGIDLFKNDTDVGLIAVRRTQAGSCSNRDMPQARMIQE